MQNTCVIFMVLCQNILQYETRHSIQLHKIPVTGFFSTFQDTRIVKSKIQCAVACAKLENCSAMSFSRTQSLCIMSSETAEYVTDAMWVTMRIFHVETKQGLDNAPEWTSTSQTTTDQTTERLSNLRPGPLSVSSDCPSGYSSSPRGSCFYVSTSIGIFKVAQSVCKYNGGQLCTILSSAQNEDLVSFLQTTTGLRGRVYLGAFKGEEDWNWLSDDDMEYTNWLSGYPRAANITDTCMVMSGEILWKWRSVNCEDAYHYVCELRSDDR